MAKHLVRIQTHLHETCVSDYLEIIIRYIPASCIHRMGMDEESTSYKYEGYGKERKNSFSFSNFKMSWDNIFKSDERFWTPKLKYLGMAGFSEEGGAAISET